MATAGDRWRPLPTAGDRGAASKYDDDDDDYDDESIMMMNR